MCEGNISSFCRYPASKSQKQIHKYIKKREQQYHGVNDPDLCLQKLHDHTSFLKDVSTSVFIASAHTLELFPPNFELIQEGIVMIGHESDVSTAIGHGVYVLGGDNCLDYVLQKPEKHLPEELSITDSCR